MYIDPNTGGVLFQILAVVFAVFSGAVLVFSSRIKMGVARFKRALREKFGRADSIDPDSNKD